MDVTWGADLGWGRGKCQVMSISGDCIPIHHGLLHGCRPDSSQSCASVSSSVRRLSDLPGRVVERILWAQACGIRGPLP